MITFLLALVEGAYEFFVRIGVFVWLAVCVFGVVYGLLNAS